VVLEFTEILFAQAVQRRSIKSTIGLIVGIDDEEDYLTQRQVECAQREAGGLQQTQLDSPLLSVLNESGRPAVRRWSFQKSETGPVALFGHGS
jgi:hypothetical protein